MKKETPETLETPEVSKTSETIDNQDTPETTEAPKKPKAKKTLESTKQETSNTIKKEASKTINKEKQEDQSETISQQIQDEAVRWQALKSEIRKRIVGQDAIIDRIFIGLLCNGHILLEGVPGLAKTTLITTLAQAIGVSYNRIQFTPDLLPADLIGTLIYSPRTESFSTKKGPLFANLILADEINRAPAKIQSALLGAMLKQQVTIGDTSHKLPQPFFVLATQNPIDQEGTYQLPEAQTDRFMLKLLIDYPSIEQEKEMISSVLEPKQIKTLINTQEIKEAQSLVKQVYIDTKVVDYILSIVHASRRPKEYNLEPIADCIAYGASPRATLVLYSAAKAHAFLKKRHFVVPDDVKAIAPDVLRHRILLTYHAEAEKISVDNLIETILKTVPAP